MGDNSMMSQKAVFGKFILNVDWLLILSIAALLSLGFVAIYSASGGYSSSPASIRLLTVQGIALAIGFILVIVLANFNYQRYVELDKTIYLLSLALLISVLIFGSTIRGTKGWFNFGIVSFQPVEIAKLMYILVLSSILSKTRRSKFVLFVYACIILLGHLSLILLQPDFSSTLSYVPITLVLLFMAGVDIFYLLCIMIFASIAAGIPLAITYIKMHNVVVAQSSAIVKAIFVSQEPLIWIYLSVAFCLVLFVVWWFLRKLRIRISMAYPFIVAASIVFGCMASVFVDKAMKDYQRRRLVVFLDPKVDYRGSGYNIIQSKITIGSGRFLGKGFGKGTQTQLGFLPEQHTDFVFAVIGEEGGWVFSQLTILLYFLFLWRVLSISKNARDSYGSFVAAGIAVMFGVYAFINIGMVMGIMPVAGMPLLFLSYGGSSILSSMCAVGILCSIHIRRHTYYRIGS